MTESSKKLLSFIAKIGLVLILTISILKISGELIERYTPWQKYMDPRERLLWNGHYNGTKYVLFGDSEFSSMYVDSPDKTIWERFKFYSDQDIFPGALVGSKREDFISAAKIIAASWPAGTTIFINIVPGRFFPTRLPQPVGGNYDYKFRRLILTCNFSDDPAKYIKNIAHCFIGKLSFLFKYDNVCKNLIAGLSTPPVYFKINERFNRIWNCDGDFALNSYKKLEENALPDKRIKSFPLIDQLQSKFSGKGYRIVFVLTPLNRDLILSYGSEKSALTIFNCFDQIHQDIKSYLASRGILSIDLYNACDSECFADMNHTNEHGDEIVAKALAEWIMSNPL
ncbi:MAG: hypothetical protein WC156_07010 [Pedobacter sp.]